MLKKILVLLAILFSVAILYFQTNIFEPTVRVTQVLDGDTFILENQQKVRILGLDAPDINLCYGKKSKERLEQLILNKKVRLEILKKDLYKRSLATVWVDNKLVAETLLEEGLARPDYTDLKNNEQLKAAYKYAKENKLGLYSGACVSKTPPSPNCLIKGNIEGNTNKKFYHYPGCRQYNYVTIDLDRGERWFCTEAEASAAGFTKAQRCP
jgi:endonuclease YncB( thermonuclease family)